MRTPAWAGSISWLLVGLLAVAVDAADRPRFTQLLPGDTLLLLRITDAQQLHEDFAQTSMGKMAKDEQVQPILRGVYGAIAEALAQMEAQLGVTLDDLLAIPKGEASFAICAPPGEKPAAVMLLEVGTDPRHVKTLIQRGEEALAAEGRVRSVERVGPTDLVMYADGDEDPILFAIRDEVLMIASNQLVAKNVLATWDGNPPEVDADQPATLSENSNFAKVMNRCGGSDKRRPHVTFYLDPIGMVRASLRGNVGAQAGLAMLPVIGLDGLHAVGASMLFADDTFDSVLHGHLLLEHPRSGVLEILALRPGDTTPENWVPRDVASYSTLNLDVQQVRHSVASMFDSLRGEDAFQNQILQPASAALEFDIETDLLDLLDGRLSMFQWIERPVTLYSQATLAGIRLKEPQQFRATWAKLAQRWEERLEEQFFAGTKYWQLARDESNAPPVEVEAQPGRARATLRGRAPQPCFAVVGDYFLAADRPTVLRAALAAKADSDNCLARRAGFQTDPKSHPTAN